MRLERGGLAVCLCFRAAQTATGNGGFFVSGGDELSSALTPYTQMISARFPLDLAAQLRALAEQKQRRVSDVIIEAVAETVQRESERPAEETPVQAV